MICFLINKGTSAHDFLHFITGLLARLQPGTRYTFLWDNLGSHHSNMVVNAVYAAGHRIVLGLVTIQLMDPVSICLIF